MRRVAQLQQQAQTEAELCSDLRILEKENARLAKASYYSTGFRKLAFHSCGRPRRWLSLLLMSKKNPGMPLKLMRRAIFKKNGRIRPIFADWPDLYSRKTGNVGRLQYDDFLRQIRANGALEESRTLHIVTSLHTEVISEVIQEALINTRLIISSGTDMPEVFGHDLYIVVAPQMFKLLPPMKKTILFQVEQIRASQWADDSYLEQLHAGLAVLDYSRENIAALISRGLPVKQLHYVPIRPFVRDQAENCPRDIDVLFYGATGSTRRQKYLKALSKRMNIRVVKGKFGPELQKLLNRTKIVVNIHFYENALLETTRLSEALSHGAHVVSERAVDQIDCSDLENLLSFVPVGDVDAFVRRVEQALAAWTGPVEIMQGDFLAGTRYHLLRALHGVGILSFEELLSALGDVELPSDRLVLALPEETQRYDFAFANRLPATIIFPGLRDIDGWKGCALSYKLMAVLACRQNIRQLMIYEEDAVFEAASAKRLLEIERYLSHAGDWDIFSGLASDVDPQARITCIDHIKNEEFIHIDSVIGMVFGIYSHRAIEMMSRFEFAGDDICKHTIDRYLEGKYTRCLTVLPPIVTHNEALASSIHQVKNIVFLGMINESQAMLKAKRDEYLAAENLAHDD